MDMFDHKLCYVKGNFAWFTSLLLSQQMGDNWNDAPYQYNAGEPYGYSTRGGKQVFHSLVKVAFDGPFDTPCHSFCNTPQTVQSINRGSVPWLSTWGWKCEEAYLHAGATLHEFLKFVKGNGGNVYLPVEKEFGNLSVEDNAVPNFVHEVDLRERAQ